MRPLRVAAFSATVSTLLASASLGVVLTDPAEAAPPSGKGKTTTTTTVCHDLPDAAALSTVRGRTINTLFPHQGKVFYGYGDYNANTGSLSEPYGTNVSSFDPATGAAQVHLAGFKTEEVHVFRSFDGEVYAPSIDPSAGADNYNSFASSAGGTWTENAGAWDPVHVFDVAKAGGELFVAGAAPIPSPTGTVHGAATVWRSTDAGASWTVSQSETEEDVSQRNGYERYYWMGVIGDKVYTRATLNTYPEVPAMRVLDTTTDTWSEVPEPAIAFGVGVVEANRVVSWQNRLWTTQGALVWFDGTSTGSVSLKGKSLNLRVISIGDDGLLYAADSVTGSVFRVDSGKKGYVLKQVATIEPGAPSFTVVGGQVWSAAAAGTARVCSSPLG